MYSMSKDYLDHHLTKLKLLESSGGGGIKKVHFIEYTHSLVEVEGQMWVCLGKCMLHRALDQDMRTGYRISKALLWCYGNRLNRDLLERREECEDWRKPS